MIWDDALGYPGATSCRFGDVTHSQHEKCQVFFNSEILSTLNLQAQSGPLYIAEAPCAYLGLDGLLYTHFEA